MRGQELFHDGLILRDLHRFKAAAKVFHEVRTLNPDFSEAWFWEAVSLDNSGNEMDAIPCYLGAIRLGVSDKLLPKAFLWLSSSYSRGGTVDNQRNISKGLKKMEITNLRKNLSYCPIK